MPLYTVFLVLCAKILVKQLIYWYIYIHNSLQEWVYQGSRTKYGSIAVYVTAFSMALGRVTQAVHITKESMRTSLIISCFSMDTSMQSWRHYILWYVCLYNPGGQYDIIMFAYITLEARLLHIFLQRWAEALFHLIKGGPSGSKEAHPLCCFLMQQVRDFFYLQR